MNRSKWLYCYALLFLIPHLLLWVMVYTVLLIKAQSKALWGLVIAFAIMAIFIIIYPDLLHYPITELGQVIAKAIASKDLSGAVTIFLLSFRDYSALSHIIMASLGTIMAYIAYRVITINNSDLKSFNKTLSGVKNMRNKKDKAPNEAQIKSTVIGSKGNRLVTVQDNAKHVFASGTTGSGKTVLLSNFIEHGVNMHYPMVIIDGKGDTGKGSIYDILHKIKGDRKLYIVDMNNIDSSAKYNPFADTKPTIVKDMLINLTEWSEEHYKTNAERYIQRVLFIIDKMAIPVSFTSIIKYMEQETFKDLCREALKQEVINKDELLHTSEIIRACSKIAEDASARFVTMAESELGQIFSDQGIDIYQAVEEDAIILFILDPLSYPELSPLLGRLILTDAKKAVNKLYTKKKERVFFIFDEINVYASPLLINLLGKARSANITCVLATQSLSDLEDATGDAFKEQVIENCNNYIVLRQNSAKSAEDWANIFGTRPSMEITYQIGDSEDRARPTGRGSAKQVREFLYHPDEIKWLDTGKAIFVSKDTNSHCKVSVRMEEYK